MELKKLKKLVLKKDVVSKLENDQMNKMRGGTLTVITLSADTPTYCRCRTERQCDGYGNQNTQNSCENKESCVPRICPGDPGGVTVDPTLVIGGCETHYLCY